MLGGSGMGPAGGLLAGSELSMSLGSPFPKAAVLTPEQVRADVVSRTAFEGLRREAAVSLAKRDFRVSEPAWTSPGSQEAGAKLERYIGEDSVAEKLPGGGHALLSSTIPLRVNDGSGLAPVSLTLRDDGEAYVPANPLASVAISTHAADGIAFADGLSVAAVPAAGTEAPVVVGNRVLFANAARDSDLLEEPRPSGAAISWQLRSQDSPSDEGLAFRLPAGAVLQRSSSLPGAVEVLVEGKTQLRVRPAATESADGVSVPVSYSISGNVLTTRVDLSGTVDFPVLVDPEIEVYTFPGFYGTANSAHVWSNWRECNSAGRCKPESCNNYAEFCGEEYSNLIQTGMNPSGSAGAYGEWYIRAPGPQGKAGSAGITRVDLTGVTHRGAGQSEFIGEIGESNGEHPIYSWDGYEGASGYSPLVEAGNLTERPIAFCAQEGGGHDGGYPPLCDEELNQGKYFLFADRLTGASQTEFNYARVEGATVTYREPAPPNRVVLNHPGYEGRWLKTGPTDFTIEAESEGLGVGEFQLEAPAGHGAVFSEDVGSCDTQNGFAGCPSVATSAPINLAPLEKAGVYELAPVAIGAGGFAARPSASHVDLYLDKEPPVIGEFTGSLGQAANGVVGGGSYTLNFSAEDGSHSSPQSGVRTLEVKVDGKLVDTVTSACSEPIRIPAEGCFDLSGSWTMNGQSYGAGTHTVIVVAKDWVGNESSKSFVVTVNEAAYQPLGPGAVNLQSGDFKLNPTDVSIAGGDASLSVSRSYDSRELSQGATGPLGSQWMLSLPDTAADGEWQSLSPLTNGSVAVYGAHGNEIVFAKEGSGYNSPAGYQTDTLSEPSSSPAEYEITDAQGNYTRFTQSESGASFLPSIVAQAASATPAGLNKVIYKFTTKEGITEPTEVLAPEPSEGACTAKLVQGCRALTFSYATSTSAEGEGPSEWGEYKGRLSKVSFTSWEPTKSEMTTTAVAQYAYDKQGRLRAEWDPRLSTPLKTTYGYDSEGHVTALTPPGHETWAFTYGTIAADSNPGRLLKVTEAPASAPLWAGETPASSEAPILSGSPQTGVRMGVSKGAWSGNPVAYSYRWEDCNSSGAECTPILGADNPNYTPAASDVGHTLVAQVTAINGEGSVTAASKASSVVVGEYPMPNKGEPLGIASGPDGNLWAADGTANMISKLTTAGEGTPFTLESPFHCPDYITAGPEKENALWFTDCTHEIGRITTSGSVTAYNVPSGGILQGITVGPDGNLWFDMESAGAIGKITPSGTITEYKLPSGSEPMGITAGPEKENALWFTDRGTGHIGKITTSGTITEYKLSAESEPYGIVAGPDGNLWFTASLSSYIGKITPSGTITEYKLPNESHPRGIAVGSDKNLWFADYLSNEIGKITTSGAISEFVLPAGSRPDGIAAGPNGNLWYTDSGTKKVGEFNPSVTEAEAISPGPGITIDYQVSGAGVLSLTPGEVAQWGQTDLPAETTAIFPAGEPQGWPASGYKQATIFYIDSANRTVNIASPSDGISTTEYGLANNVTRTLSPDNRELALKAGGNSAEEARVLSTSNVYNSAGTELTESHGPAHMVKLANGSEVSARKHTQYFYDEGSPGGATYNLVTKTVESAELKDGEEYEVRTVKTSYSGQENLGWKLRAPTSTETSDGYENLTTTTSYESSTGEVSETRTPTGSLAPTPPTGNKGAHITQTIYYTAAANSTYPACGKHPEWASLPCQGQHAAQPESGLPNLPVTTYTYSIWDEPLTTTDTVGSTTRTTTLTYDAAGRPLTNTINSSVDKALPTFTDEYSPETGALIKQTASKSGNPSKSVIMSEFNKLGQLTSYTDASGNNTKYEYENEKEYRLLHVIDGEGTPAASTQTYGYNTTTGELTSLKDSAAGTFTASYDVEGSLTTEGYPNGMNANYTYNPVDELISLEYIKTTHCTSNCNWYTDGVTPSIHGQWLSQISSFSKENYTYDQIGRLTEAQEIPTGKDCTARLYAYDEDGNRTSLTTRASSSETCATEGGTSQNYAYDTGDRLDETGVSYETFGNITSLPAADAGGSTLTSTYYVDNMLASQEQNGEKIGYNLDPAGRILETISSGTTSSTVTSHYQGPESSPASTITSTGSWTRNITGINGALAAIQTNGATPMLQLADLHGDIIATASTSETESKLIPANETSEYGVPRTSITAKYSWLGAGRRPTELPTGIINMGARTYIPQLGRFEQTDPQPGGSVNAYAYTDDDPVNESDPSGEATYNYGAAETGSAAGGLPEAYGAPGAIKPPPADIQAETEFAAHPPWDAAYVFTITLGGGGDGAYAARTKSLWSRLNEAYRSVEHVVSNTFNGAVQQVEEDGRKFWDGLQSGLFEDAFACYSGAEELTNALDSEQWSEYPVFTATFDLVGCSTGIEGAEYGGSAKNGKFAP